jgi:hypothetical protein
VQLSGSNVGEETVDLPCGTGPAVQYRMIPEVSGFYQVEALADYDVTIALQASVDGACGAFTACNDDGFNSGTDSAMTVFLHAGQPAVLVVASFSGQVGNYDLDVRLVPEERCDVAGDEDADGNADCDDADCALHPACAQQEVCAYPGDDEDGDQAADCDDDDCDDSLLCGGCVFENLGELLSDGGEPVFTGGFANTGDTMGGCGDPVGQDLVLKWRAPTNGIYEIRATHPLFTPTIGVANACGDDAGICTTNGLVTLDLTAGAERLFVFSSSDTNRRNQTVEVTIELQ